MVPTRRGILYVTAVIAVIVPPFFWVLAHLPAAPSALVVVPVAYAQATPTPREPDSLLMLAQRDPLTLVRLGHERYEREVRDYRCVLVKQERIDGQLSPVQEIEVRFRKSPLTIYMLWRQNEGEARRALYKDDPAFVDAHGNKLARVEPAGAVVRLFVKDVLMPIHGARAQQASRRRIDECGFGSTFEIMEHFSELGRQNGVLDVRFGGLGQVDGRPTFVIVRHLPYTGGDGPYPDAKLVLHLDRESLLPVGVESYADAEGQRLLGRYAFTKVQLNPGLTEQEFEF